MTGALVILAAIIVIGVLLYVTDVTYFRHHHAPESKKEDIHNPPVNPTSIPDEEICCGQHQVCEKTSLSLTSNEIEYYDDEELDRFAGREAESYSFEETEEFRDVMLTLLPQDVAGWAKSIALRGINLPSDVKDELFLLVAEQRASMNTSI